MFYCIINEGSNTLLLYLLYLEYFVPYDVCVNIVLSLDTSKFQYLITSLLFLNYNNQHQIYLDDAS